MDVIELQKRMSTHYDTAMFYMSDHGESLGEQGLYLHGLPYAIAPNEQNTSLFSPGYPLRF